MPALKTSIDPSPIRQADAVRLMVHHLTLATAYFEATPDTMIEALAEIPDAFGSNEAAMRAARQWYILITAEYHALDQVDAGA